MPLRITVQLIPHGDESKKCVVGVLDIENNLTGTTEFGNYNYQLQGLVHHGDGAIDTWHSGDFKGFERKRGYWALVQTILSALNLDDHTPTP